MITILLISFAKIAEKSLYAGMDAHRKGAALPRVQAVVGATVAAWSPVLKGKQILTPSLRAALVGALGHLAFNLAAADGGKGTV